MKPLSPALTFADLRDKPFVVGGMTPDGFDCRGCTYIVLARLGTVLAPDAIPSAQSVEPSPVGVVPTDLPESPWARHWRRVRVADAIVGDVAFFASGEESHVAPIVSVATNRPILILSASKNHGAHILRLTDKRGLVGIYRPRSVE